MTVTVLYSPGREGEVLSLGTLLRLREITFAVQSSEPSENARWKPWIEGMKNATHSVFLPGLESWKSGFWLWAAGYAMGTHKKKYIHSEEGNLGPFEGAVFQQCQDFDHLVQSLMDDRQEWDEKQKQREAEAELKLREKEISISGFVSAVKEGSLNDVLLYLQTGFSPDSKDRKGVSVLNHAVRSAQMEIAEVLIIRGAQINVVSQDRGNTPLMDAAAENQIEVAEMLLARHAELEVESKNGQTALVLAVGRKAETCARKIFSAGGDPNHADILGMSAITYAKILGMEELSSDLRAPG